VISGQTDQVSQVNQIKTSRVRSGQIQVRSKNRALDAGPASNAPKRPKTPQKRPFWAFLGRFWALDL
jgi:hypothetical protein